MLYKDKNPITAFAMTNFRGKNQVFGIKEKDRAYHTYIIGKSGCGKSTLLENMAYSDVTASNGFALIDPHGDLAEHILDLIPKRRIKDIIYFNPADLDYPIAFNPLEKIHPDHYHLVTSGLISVFKKLHQEFWGPRLEHILRHAILTLLEYPQSTILDIPRLLTDKEFRRIVLESVANQQIRDFWFFEFDKYSAFFRSEAISPILNKIGQFLASAPLRNIVGQKENTFDLRQVMDEGKILIVNLAKGKIGEDNCALLGAMLVTKIQLAAFRRADVPEDKRRPFYLYVDEFHNFLTLSFASILSESRKYGLNLILAHQYINQLDEKIRSAIFGNVGTLISFRVGAEDGKYLEREFWPVFGESDLVNLPNYDIYLKLMIDGMTSNAFSAKTLLPVEKKKAYREEITKCSRLKYAREKVKVDKIEDSRNYLIEEKQGNLF